MRSPLSSRTNSRPGRVTPDAFFDLVASSVVIVCPSRSGRMLWLLVGLGGRVDVRAMGRKSGMGVRVAFDRLDAVVLEKRVAEAHGVHAGYCGLALLHRAEAAAPRETKVLAAIFTGTRCSWCT